MLCRLLVAAAIALSAKAAQTPGPAHFYIVSESFSDYGPSFYYRLLDVQPDGTGSLIRYARVAPASVFCRRQIIQAAEARVPDKSPAQLAGVNNPCAVKLARLDSAIKKYSRRAGTFETISFGIIASCGGADVRLALPISVTLKFDAMKSAEPTLARLWDLASDIEKSVFGPNDIFHDRTESDDLALQRAGEKLVPEVISGQYDAGLAAASGGKSTFRSPLSGYSGPVPLSVANIKHGTLLNSAAYHFTHFADPIYPPLAKLARIEGKVELQLTVSPTGEVESATATSGHPLLKPATLDAATKWRFEPNSRPSIAATINYSLNCQ